LSALPRKAVAFLTLFTVRRKRGARSFAACGQRQGLLALDLGSIFEKLLHQKTFNFATVAKNSRQMRLNAFNGSRYFFMKQSD
jgi:hypothetical protein